MENQAKLADVISKRDLEPLLIRSIYFQALAETWGHLEVRRGPQVLGHGLLRPPYDPQFYWGGGLCWG